MLELLRETPARRRIAVLGEMLDLAARLSPHRDTGHFAAEQGIDALLGVRGAARFMVDGAIEAGMSGSAASFFETPEAAGDFLRYMRAGDAILFKGSRGVQVEKAWCGHSARSRHNGCSTGFSGNGSTRLSAGSAYSASSRRTFLPA